MSIPVRELSPLNLNRSRESSDALQPPFRQSLLENSFFSPTVLNPSSLPSPPGSAGTVQPFSGHQLKRTKKDRCGEPSRKSGDHLTKKKIRSTYYIWKDRVAEYHDCGDPQGKDGTHMIDGRFDSGKIVQGKRKRRQPVKPNGWCFVPVTAAPGPAFRWGSPLGGPGGAQGKGSVPVGRGRKVEKTG